MLFPPEHLQSVKAWIVKRLENICDADSDVLADYVIALLDHEGTLDEVRTLCETEIPDFLKEDSNDFIEDVFLAIETMAYLPDAAPLPPRPKNGQAQARLGTNLTNGNKSGDFASTGLPPAVHPLPARPPTNPMKRGYQEQGDEGFLGGGQNGYDQRSWGGRQAKQARRNGPGKRRDWDAPNDPSMYLPPPPFSGGQGGNWPLPPGVAPSFPDMPYFGSMPMPMPMPDAMNGAPGTESYGFPMPPHQANGDGAFNPNQDVAGMNGFMAGPNYAGGQYGGRGGQPKHLSRKQRKAEMAANRRGSTVLVEHIPPESLNENAVREFFSQFGEVTEVTMRPERRQAVVSFDTWVSANAAFTSPKAVFDNRFVRVMWHKEKSGRNAPPSDMPGNGITRAHPSDMSHPGPHSTFAPEPQLDMDDFIRRQGDVQKQQEERKQKVQRIEQQMEELKKKQRDLAIKRQKELARLNAKIAGKKGDTGATGYKHGSSEAESKPSSHTEKLRAHLAALEKEAIEMGIDPDADDLESQTSSTGFWAYRGRQRGRGRGRGSFGARGRGARGGSRGGYVAGSNDSTYAAYSLDNRPKKVALQGIDFTVSEKEESLRAYLFGIGEFLNIEAGASRTDVTFKERKTAEKFVSSVARGGIPDTGGSLTVSWVTANGGLVRVATSAASTPAQSTAPGPWLSASGPALSNPVEHPSSDAFGDDHDVSIVVNRPEENGNAGGEGADHDDRGYMDYDVAGDNQWDLG